jgi:DNA-binding SARP family transcriptional activator
MAQEVEFSGNQPPALDRVVSIVDLHMLGPIEVLDASGEALKLPGVRPRGLLALLALRAPGVVSTDEIVETLWGDEEVSGPEAALHTAVNRLRKALGEEVVVTEPGGYRLDIPSTNSDLNRFRTHVRRGKQLQTLGHPAQACESYRQGLAQWHGPALTDLRQFEFAEQAARALEEERLSAVESLMESMLAAGAHDQVVGELHGLVDSFPYRERLWQLLMLALYRSGRQAEALAVYKDLRTLLGHELGIEPWPEVVDLEERILLHDPALTDYETAPEPMTDDIEYLNFGPGDVIVEQGAQAESIYWVEEGKVEVMKADAAGELVRVAELEPGQYFGELASILGTLRSATVRALVPTTVSVYDLNTFRYRVGVENDSPPSTGDPSDELRDLLRRGHYLQTYDLAAGHIERGNAAPEIRYLAVLALARSGATAQARRRYEQYGLGSLRPDSLSSQLAGDLPVLAARLDKDEALARGGEGAAWAERSARGYEAAFELSGSAYHAVNAATMWLLSGDEKRAAEIADRALKAGQLQANDYWDASTEAEAALVLGDLARASEALERAGRVSQDLIAQRATTLKQLKLVCRLKGIGAEILDPIRTPTVVHYCGHRILPAGEQGRFPAEEESRVRSDLDRIFEELGVGAGFGSLAAGADILAAEALLDRGAELNVVLPFPQDEFIRVSVVPAGEHWVERFERCLAGAASVELATTGEYLDDPVLFDFCARIAMGDALLRARNLEADAHQVAVWDGVPSTGTAGTAIDVASWSTTGAGSTVIKVPAGEVDPGAGSAQPANRRQVRGVVFADFAGFSKLSDAQLVLFQEVVMNTVAEHIDPYREHLLSGRTWGDGINLVFEDVVTAAECALELVAASQKIDSDRAGLPQLRGLRVAAHAAPVFDGWDPVSGSELFFGVGMTQAARIEPRTPEGEIYTTHAFATLAMLSGTNSFECQYVGNMPTAKQFGHMPLYALRRRPGVSGRE